MSKLVAGFQWSDWHSWQHFKPLVPTVMADNARWLALAVCSADGCRLGLEVMIISLLTNQSVAFTINRSVPEMSENKRKMAVAASESTRWYFPIDYFARPSVRHSNISNVTFYNIPRTLKSGIWLAGRCPFVFGSLALYPCRRTQGPLARLSGAFSWNSIVKKWRNECS